MESLRTLMLAAALVACGCTAAQKTANGGPFEPFTETVQKVFETPEPEVASEFACAWVNRLQQLPDPTRNGQPHPGLMGKVFLYDSMMKPAVPTGDLTIMVSDATTRAPGVPPAKTEVWHFTADVLKKKRVSDERYGRAVAVFLPWPPEWTDVNRVAIQARYDQKGTTELFAQATTLTLDLSTSGGASAGGVVAGAHTAMAGVPDPKVALRQMRGEMPANPIQQAGASMPVTPQLPPPAMPPVESPKAEDQRFVIPRR